MIVRLEDMHAIDFCNRGARQWFAQQGLSWADFVQEGIDAETLLATGDAMAADVVAAARHREARTE